MGKEIDTAFIFAAGFGKRMRPVTNKLPKPLIEVAGKKIIERIFDTLLDNGFKKIIVNTHYLANQLKDYLESKYSDKCKLTIIFEPEILETAGALINAKKEIGDKPFLTINGDVFFDYNGDKKNIINSLKDNWQNKYQILMAVCNKNNVLGYYGKGDFDVIEDESGNKKIKRFTKLGDKDSEDYGYIYSGMQILNPKILENRKTENLRLRNIYNENYKDNIFENINVINMQEKLFHVGEPKSIKLAEALLVQN